MRIVVADDHVIVRKGLQQIIAMRPGWSVAAEAATADELLALLRRDGPYDVLVLDVSFRDRSGIDVLTHVRTEHPELPVLMLSMHPEEQYALRCIRAGAAGYVQKDSPPDQLLAAIETAANGGLYVSPTVLSQMANELTRGSTDRPHERLSVREFEVFRLLAKGESVTDIAAALNVSVKTVSTYRARILEKMNFRSNADIVAYAIRNGLV